MTDHRLPLAAEGADLFSERFHEELARAARYGLPLTCLVFRVREAVNPGTAAGERLTHAAAVLARRMVRASDVVGPVDEAHFGILANTCGEGAQVLAQSLAAELQALDFLHGGRAVRVELACGISSFDAGKTSHEMLEEACGALELHRTAHEVHGHC